MVSKPPRGVRNNNPGNIKYSAANNWQGQAGSDGVFAIFESYKYGIRAMMKLLMNYHKNGFRTINSIVNKYAPANTSEENPTDNYIDFVADFMGVSPNSELSFSYNNFGNLVIAMAAYENGREDAVTPDQAEQVWAEFFEGVGGLRGSDRTGQRSYLTV